MRQRGLETEQWKTESDKLQLQLRWRRWFEKYIPRTLMKAIEELRKEKGGEDIYQRWKKGELEEEKKKRKEEKRSLPQRTVN